MSPLLIILQKLSIALVIKSKFLDVALKARHGLQLLTSATFFLASFLLTVQLHRPSRSSLVMPSSVLNQRRR